MVARAKQAGAKAWLIKPVRMDLLVDVVQKLTN
jgi:FixJ family two-component response regulator